jgi:integrase
MTDIGVHKLKPKAQRYEVWEDGRTGLGLRVSPNGRKVFIFMYWRDGKARRMTLGVYGDGPDQLSLADANVKHAEAKKARSEGRDPGSETVVAHQAERDAETVGDLIDLYLEKWARPRKRSAGEDERILNKEILPQWGTRKAKDIKRRDIIALLDGIVERGAPIQANRTLACVRRMFSWAIERDMLDASPCVQIKAPAPENRRDRALNDDELATFWHGLDDAKMTDTIRLALKFQLVTAQRKGEVIAAEWSEFDRGNGLWTIPASKAKNGVQHVVPLSPMALDVLDAIEANRPEPDAERSRLLFPSPRGDKPVLGQSVDHALRGNRTKIGVDDLTPHDLRRSAATAMAAMGVDRTVLARVLNHVDRGVTGRYDTHSYIPEKRAALERWARKLEELVSGKSAPSKVVELAEHRT